MKQLSDESLTKSLAELPEVPINPGVAEAVRRSARTELGKSGANAALVPRLSVAWTTIILPWILALAGAAHVAYAARLLALTYSGG